MREKLSPLTSNSSVKVMGSHDSGLVISCFRSDDSGRQIHDCARFRRSDRGEDNLVESYIGTSRQGDYYLRSCVLVGDRNVDLGVCHVLVRSVPPEIVYSIG